MVPLWTVTRQMVWWIAKLAHDVRFHALNLLRTLEKLMSLFSAVFTPDSLDSSMVISYNSILPCLFSLLQNSVDHGCANFKMVFSVSSKVDMQRFILIVVLAIQQLLLILLGREDTFVLWSFTTYLYLAVAFFLKLLLSLSARAYDLTNVVDEGVICFWNEYLLMLFGWFVIRWRNKRRVHFNNFCYEPVSFLYIFVFESLFSCVTSQPCFCIINWFRTRWSQIWIILLFIVLQYHPLGQIINPMLPDHYFDLIQWKLVNRQKTKTLRYESLVLFNWSPTLSFLACLRIVCHMWFSHFDLQRNLFCLHI